MDKICDWLETIAGWLAQGALPPIPFIGPAGSRFFNPPAPHLELVLVLEGQYDDLRIGDQIFKLPPQHLALHNVHLGNYSSVPSPKTKVWCMFLDVTGAPQFDALKRRPLFCCMPVANLRQASLAFERVATACRLPGAPAPQYLTGPMAYDPRQAEPPGMTVRYHLQAALLQLFGLLIDEHHRIVRGAPAMESAAVREALEYLGRHYADAAVMLDAVAAAAHMSVDHFGRVFHQATGTTPMRYLRTLRVRQSCFLLEHTGLRVSEVAAEVGFTDPYHFSRVFSAELGLSPRQYRERSRRQALAATQA